MADILIYFDNIDMVQETIEDLVDKTTLSDIDTVLICNDSGQIIDDKRLNQIIAHKTKVLDTNRIGRSQSWAKAVSASDGPILVFIGGVTKFEGHWLTNLIVELDETDIVSPLINVLDKNIWHALGNRWERFGWRWDMELCNKPFAGDNLTLSISSFCFAVKRKRYNEIGGLDTGMDSGAGEDIEISYRNWVFGGSCKICRTSRIATAASRKSAAESLRNMSRIVKVWLPEFEKYVNINHERLPDTGKINNLTRLEVHRAASNSQILQMLQPESLGIFSLQAACSGKVMSLVAAGSLMEHIDLTPINRSDIVIGIDQAGLNVECDYVISGSVEIIEELARRYRQDQLILPVVIKDERLGTYISSKEIYPESIMYEYKQYGHLDIDMNPPFVMIDDIATTSVHIGLFLRPKVINVYGIECRIMEGLADIDANRLELREQVLHVLGDMAYKQDIPIVRICHL